MRRLAYCSKWSKTLLLIEAEMDETKRLALRETFPPVTTEQWEAVIQKDLKGADYAKKLLWQTDDGITVKPYYRSEDLKTLDGMDLAPGEFPFTRGTKRESNDWRIREEIDETDPTKANELALKAIESGAEEICFVLESGVDGLRGVAAYSVRDMSVLLRSVALDKVPVHFRAGSRAKDVYKKLVEALGPRALYLAGSIDYDPLGDLVLTGFSANDRKAMFDKAAEMVRTAKAKAPLFKVLAVRGAAFHEAGSTTVQELGYAIAQAVEYVSELSSRDVAPEQGADALFFSFTVGSNYFFEIAKLRAARTLWAEAAKAFGASDNACQATIYARTSDWNATIYDPYVNVLRGTTEAMSAAIGGCDSLAVAPFDASYKTSDELSRRLARNAQIILKKESYLDRTVDPAGGSYYVESLTNSIAHESWKLMQQVEGAGGFLKSLERGTIQENVQKSCDAKVSAIGARRSNLLGTNQYPNQKERMLEAVKRLRVPSSKHESPVAIHVQALPPHRAAEVFETLRLRIERHAAKSGRLPRIVLLEIGDLKMRKARSAFASNFFGCGGFYIVTINAPAVDAAVKDIIEHDPDAIVLCSSDEEYAQVAGPIISKLRAAGKQGPVIVAGYPKDALEKLKQDGVADFIHVRSNAAEVLKTWQDKLGVRD
jgi:methylmalonyl-CoA mutase